MNNLIFYRLPEYFRASLNGLAKTLDNHRLKPISPGELITGGFVSPHDASDPHGPVTIEAKEFIQLMWMTEERVLPAEVVQQELKWNVRKIEQETKQQLTSRQRRELKEEIVTTLAARALTRFAKTDVILDTRRMLFIVGVSSYKRSEMIIDALREALGSFPVRPLEPAELDLVDTMTEWLSEGQAAEPFELGEACELHSSEEDGGAIVKYLRQDLLSDEISEHLKVGKQCVSLELAVPNRIHFSIKSDYSVRGLKFPPGLLGDEKAGSDEVTEVTKQTNLLLFGNEVGCLFDYLEKACGIAPIDGTLFGLAPAQKRLVA